LEELCALYKVYGDFNSSGERKEGEKVLKNIETNSYVKYITNGFKKKAYIFNDDTYMKLSPIKGQIGPVCSFVLWVKFNKLEKSFILFDNFFWEVSGVYIKYCHPENNLYVELFDGSGIRRTNSFSKIPTNTWLQLAFTADGKKLKTYVNGKLINTVDAGPIICNGSAFLGQYCKNIYIEDLMIFNKPLTSSEIKMLYDSYL